MLPLRRFTQLHFTLQLPNPIDQLLLLNLHNRLDILQGVLQVLNLILIRPDQRVLRHNRAIKGRSVVPEIIFKMENCRVFHLVIALNRIEPVLHKLTVASENLVL